MLSQDAEEEKTPEFFNTTPLFVGKISGDQFVSLGDIDSKLETVGVWQKGPVGEDTEKLQNEKNNDVNEAENTLDNVYEKNQDYQKGIVYYLRNKMVVGILLWNLPSGKEQLASSMLRIPRIFDDVSNLQRWTSLEKEAEESTPNEFVNTILPNL